MSRGARIISTVLLTLVAFSGASVAFAAPVPFESVDVILHTEQAGNVLLISGTLPEGTKLPAEVVLSAPQGAELSWAGQILGGSPAEDPSVEPAVSQRDGADVYAFTLDQALTGQVEVAVPSALAFDGSAYAANVEWIAAADVPTVQMSVRVPTGSQVVQQAEGAELVPGPTGFQYYRRTFEDVKAGDKLALAFTYTAPAAGSATAPPAAAGSSTADVIVPILVVAVVAIGALIVGRGVASKMRARNGEEAAAPAPAKSSTPARAAAKTSTPAAQVDEVPESAPARSGNKSMVIATVVIAVIVVGGIAALSFGNRSVAVGDTISRQFAQGDACTNASIPLNLEGTDANKASEEIFAVLATTPVISATLVPATSTLQVAFCDSQTTEDQIRAALAPTGLIDASAPAPAPAPAPSAPTTP